MTEEMQKTPVRADGRDLRLVDRLGALYVSVVSDCLDRMGLRKQVMAPRIRPLALDQQAAGYARTVQVVQVDAVPDDPADYYRNEIAAVDSLQPRDVLVTSTCEGSFWGELLSTAAIARGASGIVADAYTRDVRAILELGFPTFVAGVDARDSLGRIDVTLLGEPIECGGVTVHDGDLVLADHDGAVVVPAEMGAQVIELAEGKVSAEQQIRRGLADGESVRVLFNRFGIL